MQILLSKQVFRIGLTLQILMSVGFIFSQPIAQQQIRNQIDLLNKRVVEKIKNKDDSSKLLLNNSIYLSKKNNYLKGLAKAYKNYGVYYSKDGNLEFSQHYYFKALRIYESIGNEDEIGPCYNNIANGFSRVGDFDKSVQYYKLALKYHLKNKKYNKYTETCNNIAIDLIQANKLDEAKRQIEHGLKYTDSVNEPINYANFFSNLAIIYFEENEFEKGVSCLNRILKIYEKENFQSGLTATYYHLGLFSAENNKPKEALLYYRSSYEIAKANHLDGNLRGPLESIMLIHNDMGNQDSVFHYYLELMKLDEETQKKRSEANIHEIEIKFQTEKKEQQLILEKEKRARLEAIANSNGKTITILVIFILFLIVVFLSIWLYQKQKQQLIALKLSQKNDEIEKMINEQRVKIVESQLNGEVIERQRVASELHDRVGGLLATLNLQVEVLSEKLHEQNEVKKLKKLIKTTIQEVRQISHNLDGVGEANGLEYSLKQLQEGISSSQKIEMHLYYELGNLNLNNRLGSELFSIVQELTTNTLKHARAKNITVQLSLLDDKINLIFEDDGDGFNVLTTNLGIGLKNIEKRVEKLDGTFIIDSSSKRGTTLIANIPFE